MAASLLLAVLVGAPSACAEVEGCAALVRLFLDDQRAGLARAAELAAGASTSIERERREELLRRLDHVAKLRERAKRARAEGDDDRALALEVRRELVLAALSESPRAAPATTAALVHLATGLLATGRGPSARAAYDLAVQIAPRDPRVQELEVELLQIGRAAYLRGYGLYRDGGPSSMEAARRLWRFAMAAAPTADFAARAAALLEETAQ